VSGGAKPNRTTFGQADFTQILTNFAPRAKQRAKMKSMPQDGEIDILIATDCISEGQNLQDCDLLVNYDIHWNPVRIIQRFGRIDRIGSQNTGRFSSSTSGRRPTSTSTSTSKTASKRAWRWWTSPPPPRTTSCKRKICAS
jgi:superfamily II DNA/RNA helicase